MPVLNGSNSFVYAGNNPLEQITGSTTTNLLADALGSMRATTDATGAVIGTQNYNPYGTVRSTSGTAAGLGYTGAITDPTGLVYDQARYYNPAVGQFTSADTVIPNAAGSQGYNLYAYTAGNPTTLTDPLGHATIIEEATALEVDGIESAQPAEQFLGAIQAAENIVAGYATRLAIQKIIGAAGTTRSPMTQPGIRPGSRSPTVLPKRTPTPR